MTNARKSPNNVSGDSTQSLQTFNLLDLEQFTLEKKYSNTASKDFHLFYVGRDNVHEILKYVLSRVRVSLYLNMFGFDDDELNQILMEKVKDPNVTMLITLDQSQAGGKHEAALLDADKKEDLTAFNTHFVIGQSRTHQISHTKGFVADGHVGAEGSTNWSASGEGTFTTGMQTADAGTSGMLVKGTFMTGKNYKAQNNTQSIFTDPDTVARFTSELIAEHMAAQHEAVAADPKKNSSLKTPVKVAAKHRAVGAP
jgi:hypothetical protein